MISVSVPAGNGGSGLLGEPLDLQALHPFISPTAAFASLAEACKELGVDEWDVYGDFDCVPSIIEDSNESNSDPLEAGTSWLRTFEQEVANEFQKEDAIFMPSGVMAQSIALLIHSKTQFDDTSHSKGKVDNCEKDLKIPIPYFICHHTSHLTLHENEGYRDLLGMEPIIIPPFPVGLDQHADDAVKNYSFLPNAVQNSFEGLSPMRLKDIEGHLMQPFSTTGNFDPGKVETGEAGSSPEIDDKKILDKYISTLILELPHREIGGKITPWKEVKEIGNLCHKHGIKYHCDGARIFEATVAYADNNLTVADLAAPFDSIYISFYKGLGAISGAMLLGEKEFIEEARVWLRRFGGNLYTLLPYAVSSWKGYRDKYINPNRSSKFLTFHEKHSKLKLIVQDISRDKDCCQIVAFDPPTPVTCMVHGYLKHEMVQCKTALDTVTATNNIRVLKRIRPVPETHPSFPEFKCMFELNMGDGNGSINNSHFLTGWRAFAKELLNSNP